MCDVTSEDSQVRLCQLVLAAEQGDAGAQCTLGYMHRVGKGGLVDFAEARRLFGLAAVQGHANAQHNLGFVHRDGKGGPKDFAEARRLFGLAAVQDHAAAQHTLGVMHRRGEGEEATLPVLASAKSIYLALRTQSPLGEGGPVHGLCRGEAALWVGCRNLGKARATCAKLPAGWPPAPSHRVARRVTWATPLCAEYGRV